MGDLEVGDTGDAGAEGGLVGRRNFGETGPGAEVHGPQVYWAFLGWLGFKGDAFKGFPGEGGKEFGEFPGGFEFQQGPVNGDFKADGEPEEMSDTLGAGTGIVVGLREGLGVFGSGRDGGAWEEEA
jgi:hypothetical protein